MAAGEGGGCFCDVPVEAARRLRPSLPPAPLRARDAGRCREPPSIAAGADDVLCACACRLGRGDRLFPSPACTFAAGETASAGLTLVVGVCIRWPTGVPGRIGSFCGSGCESAIAAALPTTAAAVPDAPLPHARHAQSPPPHSVHGLSRSRVGPGSLSAPNAASCTAAAACRPAACACARSWRPLPAGDWHASSLKCRRRTPDRARFPPPHRAHELPPCRMDPDGPSAPRRTGCRAAAGRQRQPAPARRAQRSSKKGAFQPEVPPRDGRVRRCRSRSGRSAALIRQPKTWLEDAGWSAPGGGPRPGRARPACTAPTPIFGLKTIKTTTRQ